LYVQKHNLPFEKQTGGCIYRYINTQLSLGLGQIKALLKQGQLYRIYLCLFNCVQG
jgi:hypothetical protein